MAAIVGIVFVFHDLGLWERCIVIRKYDDGDPIMYCAESTVVSNPPVVVLFGAKELPNLIGCVIGSIALASSNKIVRVSDCEIYII